MIFADFCSARMASSSVSCSRCVASRSSWRWAISTIVVRKSDKVETVIERSEKG